MKNNMNIFRQYFFAITNPKKYSEMTRLGGGRVFLYMLLLSIVTTFITLAGPVTTYFKSGGATKVIDEYLPEFRLDNNSFTTTLKYNGAFDMDDFIYVDDPEQMLTSKDIAEEIRPYLIYILAEEFSLAGEDLSNVQSQQIAENLSEELYDAKFYLFIDTSVDTVSEAVKENLINADGKRIDNAIIFTKHDFAILDEDELADIETADDINTSTYDFSDGTDSLTIDKKEVMQYIKQIMPFIYAIFGVFVILYIGISMLGWAFAGLLFSIIGLIVNAITKKHLIFGTLFKISVYAQTTTIILKTLLSYTAVPSLVLTYGGYIITVIYIVFAINNTENIHTNPFNNDYQYNNSDNHTDYL